MAGNPIARSIHNFGAGAWFGVSSMGAIGRNGAVAKAECLFERTRLASLKWAQRTPVQGAAMDFVCALAQQSSGKTDADSPNSTKFSG